ncbi:MCP four helix bundle domain-containing protein, partial [Gemmata sp. JC717]|uniref:MCP four helix bundle domain-containing protein n=1 Tax=Gemmata algarum TaxID=2975278 RepID=UPI0021BB7B62
MIDSILAALSKLRLGPRLVGGFLIIAGACAFLAYQSMDALGGVRECQVNANTNLVPSALALGKMGTSIVAIQRSERTGIIFGKRGDEATLGTAKAACEQGRREADDGAKAYAALPMTDKEAALWKAFETKFAEWKRLSDEIWAQIDRREFDKAEEALVRETPVMRDTNAALMAVLDGQQAISKEENAKANEVFDHGRRTMWTVSIGAVLAAVGLGLLLTASVVRPLTATISVLEGVTKGDLSR